MGICCALHSLSDQNIEILIKKPILVWKILSPEDNEQLLQELNQGRSFFDKLFGKNKITNSDLPEFHFSKGENESDDIDKAWQGIHYCLNKTEYAAPSPKNFITEGGTTIGDIEVGYGPVRALNSKTLKEINDWLSSINEQHLKSNYDVNEMKQLGIYPDIWDEQDDEPFEYIATYFESLKDFINKCVKNDVGMLIYFT